MNNNEESVFAEAIQRENSQDRSAYLDFACANQPRLRAQVELLLKAYPKGEFLESPAGGNIGTLDSPTILELPGSQIGPYKLRELLGEGGMGSVYLAEQDQPVRRTVALKIIKPGMDSRQVIARFDAERQTLGLMDHPHIARVLDAGTTETGRPYFVMELVRGVSITEFCDSRKLDTRARLELFAKVCQAVQHAHQKGIIHRDIKPSNVLVTLHDDVAVPKVIDFGVAKATSSAGGRLTEHSIYTGFAQMIGTPLYMSPEQAELNALDVDTRSDVYSLGVLLYELLTGGTPFDGETLKRAGYDEMRRLIREVDPPRPSERVNTLGAEGLSTVTERRGIKSGALNRVLRGELDWIVMKALEKDRTRRYETASGLAQDIQRYLADEIVEARPPSSGYRLRKFARKNRAALTTAVAIAGLLVAGIAGTTFGLFRAEHRRQEAEQARTDETRQRAKAEAAAEGERLAKLDADRKRVEAETNLAFARKGNEILGSVFAGLDPKRDYATVAELRNALRDNLNKAVTDLEGSAIGDPLQVAAMQHTLGLSLLGLGEAKSAIVVFQKAIETRRAKLGAGHPDTLTTMNNLSGGYFMAGQLDKALSLIQETLKLRTATLGADHPDTLVNMGNLARCYQAAGQFDKALPLFEDTFKLTKARLGADHPNTLISMLNVASAYQDAGQLDKALPFSEETLRRRKAKLGADHPDTLASMNSLALGYRAAGQLDKALPLFEETLRLRNARLGADHPDTLGSICNLASCYGATGQLDKALRPLEETLKLLKARLGADHPDTLRIMNNLALCYEAAGQFDKALRLLEDAFKPMKARLGADHPDTLRNMNNLASTYWSLKRLDKSIPLFEETLTLHTGKFGRDHPDTQATVANLGVNYKDAGRLAEALPLLEEAHRASMNHPTLCWVGPQLLDAYVKAGNTEPVANLVQELLADARKQLPADSPELAGQWASLGLSLLQVHAFTEAEPLLRECLAIREKAEPDAWPRFSAQSVLGGALLGQERYAEAEPLLVAGYEGMRQREETIPKIRHVRIAEAIELLVQLYEATDKEDEAAKLREELKLIQAAQQVVGEEP